MPSDLEKLIYALEQLRGAMSALVSDGAMSDRMHRAWFNRLKYVDPEAITNDDLRGQFSAIMERLEENRAASLPDDQLQNMAWQIVTIFGQLSERYGALRGDE